MFVALCTCHFYDTKKSTFRGAVMNAVFFWMEGINRVQVFWRDVWNTFFLSNCIEKKDQFQRNLGPWLQFLGEKKMEKIPPTQQLKFLGSRAWKNGKKSFERQLLLGGAPQLIYSYVYLNIYIYIIYINILYLYMYPHPWNLNMDL